MIKKPTICMQCDNCRIEKFYEDGWFGGRTIRCEFIRCQVTDYHTGEKELINRCNNGNCPDYKEGVPGVVMTKWDAPDSDW